MVAVFLFFRSLFIGIASDEDEEEVAGKVARQEMKRQCCRGCVIIGGKFDRFIPISFVVHSSPVSR